MEHGVTLENMGVLDLTGKGYDLSGISLIRNIGLIVAPQSLADALLKIRQENIGMTIMLPDTKGKIKMFTGQLTLSGEVFANQTGSDDDILVISGQAVITSPIEQIGYHEIIVAGQLIAPQSSAAALANALTKMSGQIAYYQTDAPRLFMGNDKFSKDFFELIEDRMAMLLIGDFEFESDVDLPLIRQKISELIIIGSVKAPKALVPLLQLLATTKLGDITARDDAPVQSV
ncbi:hypothetical protein AB6A23_00570 [Paenibacillus tarimensis]